MNKEQRKEWWTLKLCHRYYIKDIVDRALNYGWLILRYGEYLRFRKKCMADGYGPSDIWFSRHTGFLCWPTLGVPWEVKK